MKRNDDLIRQILFKYEEDSDWYHILPGGVSGASEDEERERYHLLLLGDEGLVTSAGNETFRLTSQGHDYLNAIRSETIWKKTKDGAAQVGGLTLGIMKDLAVAYLKREAAERLGIQL